MWIYILWRSKQSVGGLKDSMDKREEVQGDEVEWVESCQLTGSILICGSRTYQAVLCSRQVNNNAYQEAGAGGTVGGGQGQGSHDFLC